MMIIIYTEPEISLFPLQDRSEELSSNVENGSCNSNEGINPETSSHWIENVVKVLYVLSQLWRRDKFQILPVDLTSPLCIVLQG